MSDNPYRLPNDDRFRVINVSGGRSSAYMLWHILDAHDGQLPNSVVVCFANTGKEEPETLDFVQACADRWGVSIVWLEYRWFPEARGRFRGEWKHRHAVVDHRTASRDGQPYDQMIAAKQMLPNISQSFCTTELKVLPVRWYVERDLEWRGELRNVLGIRSDEPKRLAKALYEECETEYPLAHAKVDKPTILRWWQRQPFDLGTENSNCDLCFKKGRGLLLRLIRERPDRAPWWVSKEQAVEKTRGDRLDQPALAQFSKRFTYADLVAVAADQGELPIYDEEPEADCFCGFDE